MVNLYSNMRRIKMSVSLKLDFKQLRSLVDQLDVEEQEKLAEYLDDKTLFSLWRKVKKELKEIPVTLDDITEEVEFVRAARYR